MKKLFREFSTSNTLDTSFEVTKYDSIFNSDAFKSNDVTKLVFTNVMNILENNPINKDTQLKLENYLFNQYKFLADAKDKVYLSGIDFNLFNKEFKEYCFSLRSEFDSYLNKLRETLNNDKAIDKNIDEIIKSTDIQNYYIKSIMNTLSNEEIMNYMFYTLFLVVTYNDMIIDEDNIKDDDKNKISVTTISMDLGKFLSNAYISKLYKKTVKKTDNKLIDFKGFRDNFLNTDKQYVFESSEFYLRLVGKLIDIMTTCDILNIKVHTSNDKRLVTLKLSKNVEKMLGKQNPIAVLPMNLPMIVSPKDYSPNDLGGYLLNNVEYIHTLIGPKPGYGIPSEIENDNVIYDTINGMMKTPFKVNKDLLNYLLENNHIHKLLISSDYEHIYANSTNRNKKQEKDYQKFLSQKMLEKYTLLIAYIYSNVPEIYFPLKLDNRGRLYPNVSFFHYQGSELAKALILFSKPDTLKRSDINAIEYLKAYGASCYGNGLNKKSYTRRIEWVKENWDNIINYGNNELVSKADEKFLFLAFCIEMKRFNTFIDNEYMSEFKTYLPIQLDGTCNGFQHLALLSNETKIFDKLNLAESHKNNDPIDFYNHVLDILNIYLADKKKEYYNEINKLIEKKLAYNDDMQEPLDIKIKYFENVIDTIERILKAGLNRKNIKPIVMNKPYNATNRTLASYVRDLMIFDHTDEITIQEEGEVKTKNISWYKVDNDATNLLKFDDLQFLVKSIDEIIYVKYNKISMLNLYFHEIGKIFNKLNIPIVWRLPTGLKVSQKYMEKRTIKVKPFSYLSNSINLSITDKLKMDKRKQLTAFMPNLVHSLDAATLTLLYEALTKAINSNNNENSFLNFYSVHDCYGVSAKYVDLLIEMLRTIYIKLYSGEGYIEKFDEDVINTIIITYGENLCKYSPETRTIYIDNRKKIVLPDLSVFLNIPNKNRVYKSLSKSLFLIK